jgi:4-amino-4-deoxy-L-arabinose transferase-like glycosyltransferase
MITMLPYLSGARPTGNRDRENEGTGQIIRSSNPDRFVASMRLGILPFFLLGALVVYLWGSRFFNAVTACIATILYSLIPEILAHSGVATTDMGLTACLGAAFLSLILWAQAPNWRRAVVLGISVAASVLSKFTTLGYLPATAVLSLVAWWIASRPGRDRLLPLLKERVPTFALAVAVGAVTIWAAYLFSLSPLLEGIRVAAGHNSKGHLAYLLGKVSMTGFWYYFPVALSVKTPIALLVLSGIGFWIAWTRRTRIEYLLPIAFSLGILITGMTSNVNIGVRHILPIYLGLSLTAATAVEKLLQGPKVLAYLLVAWMAVSGALAHPDYIAYFNEFAMQNPESVLVDSDLDWGQSSKPLARRLKELGATSVNFGVRNDKSTYMRIWPGLPPIVPIHPGIPAEGWTAISPTVDRTTQYGLYFRYPNLRPWFDTLTPREWVGSYRLYYVPPGSLRR